MPVVAVETVRTPLQPNVCIVVLHDEEGRVGLGESFWGADVVEAYLHEEAAPLILDSQFVEPERAARLLRPYVGSAGSGAETRGNGAIDIALWDLLGQRTGLSVARLLGGPVREEVRVYNTCAGIDYIKHESRQISSNWGVGGASHRYDDLRGFLERPAELVASLREDGYTALKVWPFDAAAEETGGRDLTRSGLRAGMAVMEKLREAAGEDVDLLVELHGLWSLKAATTLLRALEDVDPYWVEDPMRAEAVNGYQRLRERTRVPIAAGETLTGRRSYLPLLANGSLDVAIVDLGWVGGLTEAVAVAGLSEAFEVPFAPHDCTGPISFAATTQLVSARSNGLVAETVRAFHGTWYPRVVDGLPVVSGGMVSIGDRPGLGLTLRDDFLAEPSTRRRTTRAGRR